VGDRAHPTYGVGQFAHLRASPRRAHRANLADFVGRPAARRGM